MDDRNLEHPDITSAGRTGYPCRKKEEYPICPICGEICDTVFCDRTGELIGCDECVSEKDAWEELL